MINDNNFLFVCIIPSLFEKAPANVYLSNSLQKLFHFLTVSAIEALTF